MQYEKDYDNSRLEIANYNEELIGGNYMTKFLSYNYDHLSCIADYGTPDTHSHLALHFIFSLNGTFSGIVDGESFSARAVFISSDVPHTLVLDNQSALVYLFEPVSALGHYIEDSFLKKQKFQIADKELISRIDKFLNSVFDLYSEDLCAADFDSEILKILGWKSEEHLNVMLDERLVAVKKLLFEIDTIPHDIMDVLCNKVNLSKSRLSHLFSKQVGISLHRYLAFIKIQKAFMYVRSGRNLTEAALDAGFDSSSHLSSTFKRMFGISFSHFLKSKNSI